MKRGNKKLEADMTGVREDGETNAQWKNRLAIESLSARAPTAIADLAKRLELLAKYGVRQYRDGILSIDLDPSARNRDKKRDDEQPFIVP